MDLSWRWRDRRHGSEGPKRLRTVLAFLFPSRPFPSRHQPNPILPTGWKKKANQMPQDAYQGLYFMLGLLLAFYLLVPFLERAVR